MIAKSLLLTAARHLAWVEEELPPPGPGEILAETTQGAVSVGAELPMYRGDRRGSPIPYPFMTGYESLARVLEAGPGVTDLAPGDRLVATYGHRTHALLAERRAIPVPDDIPGPAALLVILACDSAKGLTRTAVQAGEAALVTGAGVMGLLTVFNLAARGHSVDVVEPLAARRDLAVRFGARVAVAPGEPLPASRRYPVAFECCGRNRAFELLQEQVEPGGRIGVLSDGNLEPLELSPAFHDKELTVVGSSNGLDYRQYSGWYFEQVRRGAAPFQALFEVEVGARDLAQQFERMASEATPPLKVRVRYT